MYMCGDNVNIQHQAKGCYTLILIQSNPLKPPSFVQQYFGIEMRFGDKLREALNRKYGHSKMFRMTIGNRMMVVVT